ncbi:MAG: PadR family transcriptional regulator [Saccharofermentanales bacterium]
MDTQLKKGVLGMCILQLIARQEIYGYEVMKRIQHEFPDIYEGSIYAVLRRLAEDGCAETVLRPSVTGPMRKYYHITESGQKLLDETLAEWRNLYEGVVKLGIDI